MRLDSGFRWVTPSLNFHQVFRHDQGLREREWGKGNSIGTAFQRIEQRQVRDPGLIGERIGLTWSNNVLELNWDEDLLAPL